MCQSGKSLTFGGNECQECSSNIHILLAIPQALAGVVLVIIQDTAHDKESSGDDLALTLCC